MVLFWRYLLGSSVRLWRKQSRFSRFLLDKRGAGPFFRLRGASAVLAETSPRHVQTQSGCSPRVQESQIPSHDSQEFLQASDQERHGLFCRSPYCGRTRHGATCWPAPDSTSCPRTRQRGGLESTERWVPLRCLHAGTAAFNDFI